MQNAEKGLSFKGVRRGILSILLILSKLPQSPQFRGADRGNAEGRRKNHSNAERGMLHASLDFRSPVLRSLAEGGRKGRRCRWQDADGREREPEISHKLLDYNGLRNKYESS